MRTFIFRCPTTGQNVQGMTGSEPPEEGQPTVYEGISCLACPRMHMVNPHTGKLFAEEVNRPN